MGFGHQSTLSINSVSYAYRSESLQKRGTILERPGIRGTRSHDIDDTRIGPYTVEGSIVIECSVGEFETLLKLAMGGATLAETVSAFDVIIDRVQDVFRYTDCKITKFTFSSSEGQLATVTLDLIGKEESLEASGGGALSAPSEPTDAFPIQHADLDVALAGVTCTPKTVAFSIDNAIVAGQFRNSLTVTDTPEGDRTVTFDATLPYDSVHDELYDGLSEGVAGSITFLVEEDGSDTATVTFTKLMQSGGTPTVGGKAEIDMTISAVARKDGATLELILS